MSDSLEQHSRHSFEEGQPPSDKTIEERITTTVISPARKAKDAITSIFSDFIKPEALPTGDTPVKIDSNIVVGVLGSGGMAQVYKIWNERLEVYRAIKLLVPSSKKELAQRFETEAKITAKLHHPNIVEIYTVGEWQGIQYIEMELVDGVSLDNLISKYGRMPDLVACSITLMVARALQHAHDLEYMLYGKAYTGIIHRDLKPANIMISNTGTIKLMDFGIARPVETSLHTMDGHIVGTLQYLSPEQLDGQVIDNRSDIYSLGTILYEMLAGIRAFPQPTLTSLIKMKSTNSYRKLDEYGFKMPGFLANVVEKCLKRDPQDRFQKAQQMLAILEKNLAVLSQETPEEILKRYISDPISFKAMSPFSKNFINKKLLIGSSIGMGALILLCASFFVFVKLKNQQPEKTNKLPEVVLNFQNPKPELAAKETTQVTQPPAPPVTQPDTSQHGNSQINNAKNNTSGKSNLTEQNKQYQNQAKNTSINSPNIKSGQQQDQEKNSRNLRFLDQMRKQYKLEDPISIASLLCEKGQLQDALAVFNALPLRYADSMRVQLVLLWIYVEKKNYAQARSLASRINDGDSMFELIQGRLSETEGLFDKALVHFQAALTKRSLIRSNALVRNDALYYTALVRDRIFQASKDPEDKFKAANAWLTVKKIYQGDSQEPRFILANKKLSE